MKNRFFIVIFILFSFVNLMALSKVSFAQDAKDFDFNKNGQLDTEEERDSFLKHVNSQLYREIDKNKDGKISQQEQNVYEEKLVTDIIPDQVDFDDIKGTRSGIPNDEVNKKFTKKSTPKPKPFAKNILIRRSHEDISILNDPKAFQKAEGALFSYTRDLEDNNDIWLGRGAIMYLHRKEIDAYPTEEDIKLTAISIVPSISFDRVSNDNDKNKDVDSLIFRAGTELEFLGGNLLFDSHYFRASATYATDFDIDSEIIGAEFQYEPVKNIWGIGTSQPIFGSSVEYRLRPIFHTEFGRTIDAGDKNEIKEDDTFLRLGPKLRLDIWPTIEQLKRLTLYTQWQYLDGIEGEPGSSELFEMGLNYRLDELGHALLELNYRDGEAPFTKDKTETFSLGLGVKF